MNCTQAGDRIETYANSGRWTLGTVIGVREGITRRSAAAAAPPTYDVLFEDGTQARHVFVHTLRYAADAQQPLLVTLWYAAVLTLCITWPLLGGVYYRITGDPESYSKGTALSGQDAVAAAAAALAAPAAAAGFAFVALTAGRLAVLATCSSSGSSSSGPGSLRIGCSLCMVVCAPFAALGLLGVLCAANAASQGGALTGAAAEVQTHDQNCVHATSQYGVCDCALHY